MPTLRQSTLLHNGQTGVRALFAAEVRVLSESEGLMEYVASDETIDSYKEIVRADGWKFDLFKKNAPFVDTHDYSTIGKLIGSVVDWRVDKQNRKLIETVRWAKDVEKNMLAQLGWQMLVAGFGPKAVSVGFMPTKYVSVYDSDPKAWREQLSRLGLDEDDGVRVIYTEQQQIELSACILGANPNALQMARKAVEAGVLTRREFQFLESARTAPQFQIPFESQPPKSNSMSKNFSSRLKKLADKFDGPASTISESTGVLRAGYLGINPDAIQRILENPERRLFLNTIGRKMLKCPLNDEQKNFLKSLDEESGFGTSLIADDFADEIYNLLAQYGAWASLGVQIIRSKRGKFAITTSYPNASFVLQGVDLDETESEGGSFLADTVTIACLINCSVALAQDSEVDISEYLLENYTEAFNQRLDTAVFIGNGVEDANNGGITGIFTDNTIQVVKSSAGNTALEKCVREDFLNVIKGVSANALQRPCRWWISSALLPFLMQCTDKAGRALVVKPAGQSDFYLLDFPITLVAVAPAVNQATQKVMAFGDPRSYAVALRNWFMFESSTEAMWNTLQRSFRAYGNATGELRVKEGLAILQLADL